ncbi:succinyl-diaminopimelate desuccinylase [Sandaracinobacteroides saxicola]|uniref:Succinyl-diaminopimelate desuccinylase n=1 Tax=Sandaracinobacteroides saxicola TaxID=2759707 RepID=A0A7G5IG49_9SPHN|nr:succinyl-diaminopimelate desuccinylase [Sandaracinobacteroides saxicola]QMW22341.1 succinyl-diaminopimelate desuccinylase [Sandaracinobacteroides saxicola]
MLDPLPLAQALIRCASVTPADAGALDVLEAALRGLGFTTQRLRFGGPPDGPVDNLFARAGTGAPHFAFAGHSDVVPAGAGWSVDPFAAIVDQGVLIGRGANDMKGALAAMVAAAGAHVARGAPGSLSFIITGDEEGPATFGTDPLLDWMVANGHRPDHCLVGEPTSARVLGDMVKIGRRGSLNCWVTVNGAQGHVAYPARADNPVTRLVRIADRLKARVLDDGNDWFDASNLEVTDLSVGNPTTNLIPAQAALRLNIRFNSEHRGSDLQRWIEGVVAEEAPLAEVVTRISGEAFITEPCGFTALVADAVAAVTGETPVLSTTGGTSDARFIRRLCPVVEFGLPGATMHKVDESVSIADLSALAATYDLILRRYFA